MIPIGRVFGIQLVLHYSWFFILAMITWALSAGYFPTVLPERDILIYWFLGFGVSLLFFTSLLVHEMSHSLVAQAAGIPIKSITLFVLGGISRMTKEPDKPGVEFRIALAGPLSSLLISGAFWGLFFATRGWNEPLEALTFWLAWINMILAVFNLLPAFPLDGGRVLRAVLWWRKRNYKAATRIASIIGQGMGYLLIFGGIWLVFAGLWVTGIWLTFVGFFLQSAARGSYRQVVIQGFLEGHTVSEVMTLGCPSVSPDTSIDRLIRDHILGSGRRCFPVVKEGGLRGLVSLKDIKGIPSDKRATKTVHDAMVPLDKLRWVDPSGPLLDVLDLVTGEGMDQVPVMDNGAIVGMVGRDTLLSFVQDQENQGRR